MFREVKKALFIFLLLLMAPLAGVGIDLFVPSLPAIAKSLNTSQTLAKMTVSLYLFGYALGQPFFGSLSDSYGRKKLLIWGLGLYVIVSAFIAFSTTISMMLVLRVLQGIFVAAPGVLSKTILTDAFLGEKLIKISTSMSMAWAIGPIVAPVIGGYLGSYFGWQSCFYFFTAYGLLLLILTIFFLKETNIYQTPLNLRNLFQTYKMALSHKEFIGAVICLSISYSLVVVFNVAGPFLVQTVMGYSQITYGHLALLLGIAFFIGSLGNRILLRRSSYMTLLFISILYGWIVSIIMNVTSAIFGLKLAALIIPIFFLLIAAGFILPNSMAKALSIFPKSAGTATAILGSFFITGSAIVSLLATLLDTTSLIPISIAYFILMTLCLIVYLLTLRNKQIQ